MPWVTIAVPLCAPARIVEWETRRYFTPYGFQLGRVQAHCVMGPIDHKMAERYWEVSIEFSKAAVEWGEYVLLRSGATVLGRLHNPKNQEWADQYLRVPEEGEAWYRPDCKHRPKNLPPGATFNANPPRPWSEGPRVEERRGLFDNKPKARRRSRKKKGDGWFDF